MSDFLARWVAELSRMLVESGPWLLAGLVAAGALRAWIREERIARHLGRGDLRSVAFAALAGAPLPLCSCSVVPTAAALRRSGASKGATAAFLVSTPETGLDSIGITWALFDARTTILRPLAAVATAIAAGALVNRVARGESESQDAAACEDDATEGSCCADEASCGEDERGELGRAPRASLRNALGYAFGPLLADLAPSLAVGFALSALVAALVPAHFFQDVLPSGWPAMLAMLAVGVPTYVCAAASTPVAAALVAKGLDPGAALVFLLAGPATNLATIAVVKRLLGARALAAYLASIAGGALAAGWVLDALEAGRNVPGAEVAPAFGAGAPGIGSMLAGGLLAALVVAHLGIALARRRARAS